MPRYLVNLVQTIGHSVEVEADNPTQAGDKALEIGSDHLCRQCADITDLDSHGWEVDIVATFEEYMK